MKQHYLGAYARWTKDDIAKWIAANPNVPLASPSVTESALGSIRRYYDSAFENWQEPDLRGFLEDHGIVEPHEPTRATLLDTVRTNWDRVRNYATETVDKTAHVFDHSSSSDSQLRAYLLEEGIISPASSREELLLQIQQMKNTYATGGIGHNYEATDSVSSGVSRVASAVSSIPSAVGEAATASFYSVVEAPTLAYDYVTGVLQGQSFSSLLTRPTTDVQYDRLDGLRLFYVGSVRSFFPLFFRFRDSSMFYSSRLLEFAKEHHLVQADGAPLSRDQLLDLVRKPYSDAAQTSYETWSDSRLRNWLVNHGVVAGKKAKDRNELLELLSKNYHGARDTS